jgi:NAD(P)-dependent dehydrogenase (short-subunit alcohol dehydrogenase family)
MLSKQSSTALRLQTEHTPNALLDAAHLACGPPLPPPFPQDTPLREARLTLETNYLGAVAMVGALAPHMVRRRSGTIVNVG